MCSPACAAASAKPGSAKRIPLVAAWTWLNPSSFALRTTRRKSGWSVGSPPVS